MPDASTLIIISVVTLLISLVLIITLPLWVLRKKIRRVVALKFPDGPPAMLSHSAGLFGLLSKGDEQIRGSGVLALADDELWFLLAYPATEFIVPLKAIRSVSITKTHLDKTSRKDLLLVEFDNDEISLVVEDPQQWKEKIEAAIP